MGGFVAAEMTPHHSAPAVKMPVLIIQGLERLLDSEPRRRAKNLRFARKQREGTALDRGHRRFKDGYNYFGKHPEKAIAFFDKHMK